MEGAVEGSGVVGGAVEGSGVVGGAVEGSGVVGGAVEGSGVVGGAVEGSGVAGGAVSGALGTEKERRPPPNVPQYDTSSNFTNLADVGSMQNIFGGTGLVLLVSGKVEERTSVHGPSESLLM